MVGGNYTCKLEESGCCYHWCGARNCSGVGYLKCFEPWLFSPTLLSSRSFPYNIPVPTLVHQIWDWWSPWGGEAFLDQSFPVFMWTLSATPNKMAPAVVDLCAGLVVPLPLQIRRFFHGFFSTAVLDWSLRCCPRVSRLRRQQAADNGRYRCRSFLPQTSSLRCQILPSKRWYSKHLDEAAPNFFSEPSVSEKFRLWKIPMGNHIHLKLTSMCGFSLNPPPPPGGRVLIDHTYSPHLNEPQNKK